MKRLLNKTILKDCNYYSVRRYNRSNAINLTAAELEIFKVKNNMLFYIVTTPARRKAIKMYNILNSAVFCLGTTGIILATFELIKSKHIKLI